MSHYSKLSLVSTDLTYFGGNKPGCIRWHYDPTSGMWQRYVLVKAAGTIPANALFKRHTTSALYDVVVTDVVADIAQGVNSTGASRSSGEYFWGLQGPVFTVLDAAGGVGTVGEKVGLHATTDGNADTYDATGVNYHCIGVCYVATSGGVAQVYGWMGGGM